MNPNMMAQGKSLQDLMDAMDEDDSKKLPGITIEIISGPGQDGGEPDGDEDGDTGQPMNPFEALLKKKQAENLSPMDGSPRGY